jgi:FAD/FMN-containing dehydrogenase
LVLASRQENSDLFKAAIGGYGLLGVIVEATLRLTDNVPMERRAIKMSVKEYLSFFQKNIKNDKKILLHNANLYPDALKEVISITWYKTDKPVTEHDRLRKKKRFYIPQMIVEQVLARFSPSKKIRPELEIKKLSEKDPVVWRNYEMSYTVRELEPFTRFPSTTVLQEYFIPVAQAEQFINGLRTLIHDHKINVINISMRYVPKNTESVLSYARQDSFAFVLYINIWNTVEFKTKAKEWTIKLIDQALSCKGTYYLPYQLYATRQQLRDAYPRFTDFLKIKDQYDPEHHFVNRLFEKYA